MRRVSRQPKSVETKLRADCQTGEELNETFTSPLRELLVLSRQNLEARVGIVRLKRVFSHKKAFFD